MYKLVRFAKIIARSVARPVQRTFYRIPQIQQVVGDKSDERPQFDPQRFQNYLQNIQEQFEQQQKSKFQLGLGELVKINAQIMIQNNFIRFAGDYNVCVNPDQFIHAIQLYRMGALAHFFSIDDLETINSSFISEQEIEFQDSQVF